MFSITSRFLRVLAVLAAVGLFASAAPARAAEYTFADPAGDATTLIVDNAPKESDPELDILSVTFSSDADSLMAVIKLASLGTPQLATGATRVASFTYEGAEYHLRYQAPQPPFDNVSRPGFNMRKGADPMPCGRCSGKLDPKTNSVIFDAEFKSMSAGMKGMDAATPPIGTGSTITGLNAAANRTILLSAVGGDVAEAPADFELVL